MANILSRTDFSTGITAIDIDSNIRNFTLDKFIEQYEPIVLRDLLGEALYQDYLAYTSLEKYTNLINGELLTIDGAKYKFEGVKTMLKYFIYYFYKGQNESYDAALKEDNEKIRLLGLMEKKLNEVWNIGVDLYNDCIIYINYKNGLVADTYADFIYKEYKKINSFGI